jgi:uncharacterized protein with von Willebrand factor type A (vWA) domain
MEHFSKELLDIIKQSIVERGIERSLQDTIANQYTVEQIQTEFHCVLNGLIDLLIDAKIVDPADLRKRIEQKVAEQEAVIKEAIELAAKEPSTEVEQTNG